MAIFQTDHWGAIPGYIALALNKYSEEDNILIFPTIEPNKIQILNGLVKIGVFDKICCFDQGLIFPGSHFDDEEQILLSIDEYFDNELNKHDINIWSHDKIYTCTDIHGVFRMYLSKKKHKYIFYSLSETQIIEKYAENGAYNIGVVNGCYMALLRNAHIFDGRDSECECVYVMPKTLDKLKDDVVLGKAVVFDLSDELGKLSNNQDICHEIIRSFDESLVDIDGINTLLAPNSIGYIRPILKELGVSDENIMNQYMLIHQHLMDLFQEDISYVTIKPHPNGAIPWDDCFSAKKIISNDFPMELFKLIPGFRINRAVSVETSSTKNVNDIIDRNISFTHYFFRSYQKFSSLYFVIKIMSYIPDIRVGHQLGLSDVLLKNLYNCVTGLCLEWNKDINSKDKKESAAIVFAPLSAQLIRTNNFLLGFGIGLQDGIPENEFFVDYFKHCDIFRIRKKELCERCYADLDDEYILIHYGSKECADIIRNIRICRDFKFSNVQIIGECLSIFEKDLFIENYYLRQRNHWYERKENWIKSYDFNRPLSEINDFTEYLWYLIENPNLICVMCVKDNAGRGWNYSDSFAFKQIGFSISLDSIYWNSFIGIINAGKAVYEERGYNGDELIYSTCINGLRLDCISKTYEKGDLASIKINENEFSLNKRGLNMVAVDENTMTVVDSVTFDFFDENHKIYR